ncbi:ferredoxin oxidoreductase [Candidatus Dojkabacteria bacterium]|nr:ferredoxin oxidoreductase [Candidatus Dojkabacteria bacterium]
MPQKENRQFLQGNVVAAHAALAAGATHFYGYPITPSSEILETWVNLVGDPAKPNKSPVTKEPLQYLQCEDEMTSGFAMIGSCLAGKKAFTTTAGPGNILMQDAFSAAEALRIPTVALIMQRGGLSTSTVIYSQEEVTLTCLGGNGEGFRVVYSPHNIQELYDYTIKAFNTAWKYRYPTFVLGDGYQGKMHGEVNLHTMDPKSYVKPKPILLSNKGKNKKSVNLRNCYDQEEEIYEIIEKYRKDFARDSKKIAESESLFLDDAESVIISHGIVSTAAKEAVGRLRKHGQKIGFWRPITLRPIDLPGLLKAVKGKKEIIYIESALGQLSRLINDELMSSNDNRVRNVRIKTMFKPALGISPRDITDFISKNVS